MTSHILIEDDTPADPQVHWGAWDTEYQPRCRLCGWTGGWGRRGKAIENGEAHVANDCRVDPAWLNILPN